MLFLLLLLLLLMMMMMMMEYANKNWIHTRCFRLVLSKLFETAHLASDANTAYMRQRCRRLNLRESLLKHVSPTWPDSCRPDDWRPSGVAMFWDDFNERRLQDSLTCLKWCQYRPTGKQKRQRKYERQLYFDEI